MKKYLLSFLQRGLMVSSGGPVIMAIIYGILGANGVVTTLTPYEVCLAIISVTLMAFIAGGITTVYQIEQLPLICAILLHGGVLYLDYLLVYLLNDWIPKNLPALASFSVIFVAGYAVVWLCVYLSIRKKTQRINKMLHNNKK